MIISVEVSYYPLADKFNQPISEFIKLLNKEGITVTPGTMSTVITGDMDLVTQTLQLAMNTVMQSYPSVFNLKISNACIPK